MTNETGRLFREAWISGVRRHCPGEPKPGYVADWAELPAWRRETDADVFEAVERDAA
ncbi:hypothetical protein [Streptomyces mayteni]